MTTATDGVLLLEAIKADPADDLARLAYADWLEESGVGGDGRAGHIRDAVVVGSGMWRTNFLWPDSLTRLLDIDEPNDAAELGWKWDWRRGFIAEVSCPLAQWHDHGSAIAAAHPLEKVTLTDRQPYLADGRHMWYLSPLEGQFGAHPDQAMPHDLPYDLPHDLPHGIWEALDLPTISKDSHWKDVPAGEDPNAHLSRACILWARSRLRDGEQ